MTIVFGAENRPQIRPLRSDVEPHCRRGETLSPWPDGQGMVTRAGADGVL